MGNGNKTLFWFHNWAVTKPLFKYVVSPILQDIEGAIVAEFWDSNRGWLWEKFSMLLPQDTIFEYEYSTDCFLASSFLSIKN